MARTLGSEDEINMALGKVGAYLDLPGDNPQVDNPQVDNPPAARQPLWRNAAAQECFKCFKIPSYPSYPGPNNNQNNNNRERNEAMHVLNFNIMGDEIQ